MKISVLMSVYDKEKTEYLKESIESIVNQTIKPNQIVIIKDGPVRLELNSVLNEYKNKYYNLFDIYQLDKNVGLGQALNYGVHKCKCEYIARMDTDDIAPLNRFEEQIKVLEEYPNLDLLGGYIEEYDCNMKKRLRVRKVPLEMEQIKKKIKYMCPFNHGTLIIKKSTLIKVGNYSPNVKIEDYELWVRMLKKNCNMKNININCCNFRTSYDMYKRRSGWKRIKAIIEIENILLKYKIINHLQFIFNITIRSLYALIPVKIKTFFKINRKKGEINYE